MNKKYRFTTVFEPQKEGGFTVTVPSLPGCISEGDTYEEAQYNIKEAIQSYLSSLIAENEPISFISDHPQEIVAPIEVLFQSQTTSPPPHA